MHPRYELPSSPACGTTVRKTGGKAVRKDEVVFAPVFCTLRGLLSEENTRKERVCLMNVRLHFRWLALLLPIPLFGCASGGQLYPGQERPKSEVVTIERPWNMSAMHILIDEKWVDLNSGTTVLPGTYHVALLCSGQFKGGTLDSVFPMGTSQGQVTVSDTFTAAGGDTVIYSWKSGYRVVDTTRGPFQCADFGYTVRH